MTTRRHAHGKRAELLLPLCLLFAAHAARAQAAYKVDEAVSPRCDYSEVPQITDPPMPVFAALEAQKDARAAVVVYGMRGDASRYARNAARWMEGRGFAPERFIPLYGGPAEPDRMELWIVPKGAPPPPLNLVDEGKSATLFDTYVYWDGEYNYCGVGRDPSLRDFAAELRRRPGWRGRVVVRPHRNKLGVKPYAEGWDSDGISAREAARRAARDKRRLVRTLGLDTSRVEAFVGGEAEWTHSELWLVPPGAQPPAPKATGQKRAR